MEPIEQWVFPPVSTATELEAHDRRVYEVNCLTHSDLVGRFDLVVDAWMRCWEVVPALPGIAVEPRVVLVHLVKMLRDLRCAKTLILTGYGAEASLLLRRAEESLNLCTLFLNDPAKAKEYVGYDKPEQFQRYFSAGVTRKALPNTELLRFTHHTLSEFGHEGWPSIGNFLTAVDEKGVRQLFVGGTPESGMERVFMIITLGYLAHGLLILTTLLSVVAKTAELANASVLGLELHHFVNEIAATSYGPEVADAELQESGGKEK